jgi:hypothetical protein
MTSVKQQNKLLWLMLLVMIVIVLSGIAYLLYVHYADNKKENKVCMSLKEYENIKDKTNIEPIKDNTISKVVSIDDSRDRRVLHDPLYPALNRSEFDVHHSISEQIRKKNLYNTTQEFTDRYRLVGYVTNHDQDKDSGGNVWKLMARQKNKNQGEFFLIPANNNYDMKIMLNNDIVTGEKLRDVYTIPKQLTFKTPLLNESPYEVTEIPMNDFTNNYN